MFQDDSSLFQGHLGSNEKLLWSGRPLGGLRLRGADVFLIPFSWMWGGFAIFWEKMALDGYLHPHDSGHHSGPPLVMALLGIPFVLVGLYLIFGRFFVDRWQREKMRYAVTSERIIILSGLFTREVKSLNLRTLSDMVVTERADGSGTITFGPPAPVVTVTFGVSDDAPNSNLVEATPSFLLIADAYQIYKVIRAAQKAGLSQRQNSVAD